MIAAARAQREACMVEEGASKCRGQEQGDI